MFAVATIGDGVEVKPSQVAGAGNGLFTTRSFSRTQLITEYCGRLIDHQQAIQLRHKGRHTHVRVLNSQHLYIDGLKQPKPGAGAASFANDARDAAINNAQFVQRFDRLLGRDRVFLRALVDLPAGVEVFASYGNSYWQHSRAPPALLLPAQQQAHERPAQQQQQQQQAQQLQQQQQVQQQQQLEQQALMLRSPTAAAALCDPAVVERILSGTMPCGDGMRIMARRPASQHLLLLQYAAENSRAAGPRALFGTEAGATQQQQQQQLTAAQEPGHQLQQSIPADADAAETAGATRRSARVQQRRQAVASTQQQEEAEQQQEDAEQQQQLVHDAMCSGSQGSEATVVQVGHLAPASHAPGRSRQQQQQGGAAAGAATGAAAASAVATRWSARMQKRRQAADRQQQEEEQQELQVSDGCTQLAAAAAASDERASQRRRLLPGSSDRSGGFGASSGSRMLTRLTTARGGGGASSQPGMFTVASAALACSLQ